MEVTSHFLSYIILARISQGSHSRCGDYTKVTAKGRDHGEYLAFSLQHLMTLKMQC